MFILLRVMREARSPARDPRAESVLEVREVSADGWRTQHRILSITITTLLIWNNDMIHCLLLIICLY